MRPEGIGSLIFLVVSLRHSW